MIKQGRKSTGGQEEKGKCRLPDSIYTVFNFYLGNGRFNLVPRVFPLLKMASRENTGKLSLWSWLL